MAPLSSLATTHSPLLPFPPPFCYFINDIYSPLSRVVYMSSIFSFSSSLETLNRILNVEGDLTSSPSLIFRSEKGGPDISYYIFLLIAKQAFLPASKIPTYGIFYCNNFFLKTVHEKAKVPKIHTHIHTFFLHKMLHASGILPRQISTKVNQLILCSPNMNIFSCTMENPNIKQIKNTWGRFT